MQFFRFLTGALPPLVQQAKEDLDTMLATAAEMFTASTRCLLDNEPLQVDLSALDERVNAGEQAVRRAVLEHLVAAPQDETSFSLLLVSIVQDAERCGDLAKTIAKIAELADAPRLGPHVEALRDIRDRVEAAYPRTREAFSKGDGALARSIMEGHDQIKADVADFLRGLTSDPDLSPNAAAVLAMAGRVLSRTSSHLSNTVSAVALPFDQVRNAPSWEAA